MAITKGYKKLIAEAEAVVDTVSAEVAVDAWRWNRDDYVFVDLRDVREVDREGMVPDAFHAPRGMLEFWVDPESPYHNKIFAQEDKTYVLYCHAGWRSALATKTLMDMGMINVKHFAGGFDAWKKAGGPVGERKKRKKD